MKYDGTNLKEVLDAHKRWIKESEGWTEEDRAYLRRADLTGADLNGADLTGADLNGADLTGADLNGAYLRRADLNGADLTGAYLNGADLTGADLNGADLTGADLRRADLTGADLNGAKNVPYVPFACPDSGAFTAWKTCASAEGRVIVKLLIPEDAKRLSSTGRKCRASKAEVLEIQTIDGKPLENVKAWSMYDTNFTYEVGKTVEPKEPFCDNRWQECESGIHFFINRQEAVNY